MRTYYTKDPRLPRERLKEAGKEGGDNNIKELSDETRILNY
jgi:hypothetical protein